MLRGDDDARYEFKSARTIRGRQARTIAKWQADGWELVAQGQGRLLTEMTFRRVKPKRPRRGGVRRLDSASGLRHRRGLTLPCKVGQAIDRITEKGVPPDSDGDGIPDQVETSGWRTQGDAVYRTNPDRRDTDGDGLTDGDEAGPSSRIRSLRMTTTDTPIRVYPTQMATAWVMPTKQTSASTRSTVTAMMTSLRTAPRLRSLAPARYGRH